MTRRHTPQLLTLDAILPHLRTKRVSKRNGERHVLAHCPAHDDANPSLSLTEKKAIVPPPQNRCHVGDIRCHVGAMSAPSHTYPLAKQGKPTKGGEQPNRKPYR